MMSSEFTDTAKPAHDLDRALAEAIASGDVESREAAAADGTDATEILKWRSPNAASGLKDVVIGLDYSPNQLTLVELKRAKQPHIQALQIVKFEEAPDVQSLTQLLREFIGNGSPRVQLALTSARSVVRRFHLPPVPKRQRRAATMWEAQKLVPFSLKESDAIYGFTFDPSERKGWQVTLAAVPHDDAKAILQAVRAAKWQLQGVSVAGTHLAAKAQDRRRGSDAATVGRVLWTGQRAALIVLHQGALLFHYDLGAASPGDSSASKTADPGSLRDWIESLGKRVSEAVELYVGSLATIPLERIELIGLPESVAPLLTDWNERLGIPVTVSDPIPRFSEGLPDNVRTWLHAQSATITPAFLAATGTQTIDMTPASFLTAKYQRRRQRVARAIFMASIAVTAAWTGLLWMKHSIAARDTAMAQTQLEAIRQSPVRSRFDQLVTNQQQTTAIESAMATPPQRWMPFAKAILATFPSNARLTSMTMMAAATAVPGKANLPSIRLDGKLSPNGSSHTLTFARWFGRMEKIPGVESVNLVSHRQVEWKGRQSTIFSVEVVPRAGASGSQP